MTHDELREVVARAIQRSLLDAHLIKLEPGEHRTPTQLLSDRLSRAALAAVWEALREPDAGMLRAADIANGHEATGELEDVFRVVRVRDAIRAAIAASPLRPAASAEVVG